MRGEGERAWQEAEDALVAGLAALNLDAALAEPLMRYLRLLDRWGKAINLTAVRDPVAMVRLHLLDSLAIRSWVRGPVADVGSGAGLPGIPLAIALPALRFTLIETIGKKSAFLRQAAAELALGNVEVVPTRAENYRPQAGFATVTSRALATLPDFVRVAGHLCAPGGRLLAMKGRPPDEEIAALPPGWGVTAVHEVHVPGLDAERTLVAIVGGGE